MLHSEELSRYSGEFVDKGVETAFQTARFDENARQADLLFRLAAILNTLFLVGDWRFYGEPHFHVAVSAHLVVIAASLIAFLLCPKCIRFKSLQILLVAWECVVAVAVAAMVASQSQIALFVLILLPSIFYLVAPTSFQWTVICGVGCSVLMLVGYLAPGIDAAIALGLGLSMAMLNAALTLAVVRSNRLRRLEWSALAAERRANERLAESQATLEAVFAATPIPMIVSDLSNGRVLCANEAALDFFADEETGSHLENIADIQLDPVDRAYFSQALARDRRVMGMEAAVALRDNVKRHVLLSAAPVEARGAQNLVISCVDISAHKAAEARLKRLAATDPLTGVANRGGFFAHADAEVRRAARYRRPLAIMMVDLDHFKRVNDEFGHAAGDLVLAEFAKYCGGVLREHDFLARYGGEEFVILLPESDEDAVVPIGERLRNVISKIRWTDASGADFLTVSIGASMVFPGETHINPALKRADKALYRAKAAGRDTIVLWSRAFGAARQCGGSDNRGLLPGAAG